MTGRHIFVRIGTPSRPDVASIGHSRYGPDDERLRQAVIGVYLNWLTMYCMHKGKVGYGKGGFTGNRSTEDLRSLRDRPPPSYNAQSREEPTVTGSPDLATPAGCECRRRGSAMSSSATKRWFPSIAITAISNTAATE